MHTSKLVGLGVFLMTLCTALSGVARSKKIMLPPVAETIPEDLREVIGAVGEWDGEPSTLRTALEAPWTTASSIALAQKGRLVVVADADNDAVVVMRASNLKVLHTVPVAGRPERLVVGPDDRAWVTCRLGRVVSVVDVIEGKELHRVAAGVEPYAPALTPGGERLLVTSHATGELLVLDTTTRGEAARVALPEAWPSAVTITPDGTSAFVTHLLSGVVHEVSLEPGAERVTRQLTIPTSGAGLPSRLFGAAHFGRRLKGERVPTHVASATVSPGGTRLFVAHHMVAPGDDTARSFRVDGYGLGGPRPIVTSITTFDVASGEVIRPEVGETVRDHSRARNLSEMDLVVQRAAQPIAIAHHPTRSTLGLAAHGADEIVFFDSRAADVVVRPRAVLATGPAPRGVAYARDGKSIFVHESQGFSVTRTRLAPPSGAALSGEGGYFRVQRVAAGGEDQLAQGSLGNDPLPEDLRIGRRLFTHANDNRVGGFAGFACASCHPDGRDDGVVWQIGAGPRQTPILTGRIGDHGPFNWLGTEDKLEDNITQTIRRLGGTGVEAPEAAALATYIRDHLPGVDNPSSGGSAAEIAAGKALFESAEVGCSGCHDPDDRFKDGDVHDIGTTSDAELAIWNEKRVQDPKLPAPPIRYATPSLVHVWASAPYLHDGSVQSLRELLTSGNPGDRMGHTSHLTTAQVSQLEAYLRTL